MSELVIGKQHEGNAADCGNLDLRYDLIKRIQIHPVVVRKAERGGQARVHVVFGRPLFTGKPNNPIPGQFQPGDVFAQIVLPKLLRYPSFAESDEVERVLFGVRENRHSWQFYDGRHLPIRPPPS